MIIKRVLNNNAVMCLDDNDNEIIVKGKGIAYNKKFGDIVDSSKIETVFRSENSETNRRYLELLKFVPDDVITVSEQAIEIIKKNIDRKLSDKIYVSLTDHIHNLIDRIKTGIIFDHDILWDVKRLYRKEYEAGVKALELLRKEMDLKIDDDEASFIALHIVNAETENSDMSDITKVSRMIRDVFDIVQSDFDLEIDTDSLDYSRFIMHLRVFFERIFNKSNLKNESNIHLLKTLSLEYPKQYTTVNKIFKYVSSMYDQPLDGEVLYLLIHVIKLTNR